MAESHRTHELGEIAAERTHRLLMLVGWTYPCDQKK
jgi:hypothetical protein